MRTTFVLFILTVCVFLSTAFAQIEFERVPISADDSDVRGLHAKQGHLYIQYGSGYSVSNDEGETWSDRQIGACSVRQMIFGPNGRYAIFHCGGVFFIAGLNEIGNVEDTLFVMSIIDCWMVLDDGGLLIAGNELYNESESLLFRILNGNVEKYLLPRWHPEFITKDNSGRWFLGYKSGDTLLYRSTDKGRSWKGHPVPDPEFMRGSCIGDGHGMMYSYWYRSIVRWNLNTEETKTISHLPYADITRIQFDENRNPCMLTCADKTGEYRFDLSADSLVFIEWSDQILDVYTATPIRKGGWLVYGRNAVYIVVNGVIERKIVPEITEYREGDLFEDSSSNVYLVTPQKVKKLRRGEPDEIAEFPYRDELETQSGEQIITGKGDLIVLGHQKADHYYSNRNYMMSKLLPLPCSITRETAHSLTNDFIATTAQCGRQHVIRYSTDAAESWKLYPIDDAHTVWDMACSKIAGVVILSIENRHSLDELDGPDRRRMRLSRIIDSSRIEVKPPEMFAKYSAVYVTLSGEIILIGDSRVAITEDFGEHWHLALDDDEISFFWGTAAIDEQGNIVVFNTRNDCLYLYRKPNDTWTIVPIDFIKEYPGSILLTRHGYVFLYSRDNGLFRSKQPIF